MSQPHPWVLIERARDPLTGALNLSACPRRDVLPEHNASVKAIRALEEQLRSHVAVKGIEQ